MEPHRHLALRKGVGKALAEAQLSTLDALSAAAAPGATASGGFEEVRHAGNSPRATRLELPPRHFPAQETRGSQRPPRLPRRSRRRRASPSLSARRRSRTRRARWSRAAGARRRRSEEHTSELQSRQYLVCRLL